jgi:3-oxoacyl-[acyl-carrier protein] reductase
VSAEVTKKLQDWVAIVTGAGQGVGRGIALSMAAAGATVSVLDINGALADQVADEITAAGGRAISQHVDIADDDRLADAVAELISEFGQINILCNNAMANEPEIVGNDRDVEQTTWAAWDRTLAVDLRAPLAACRLVIPHMVRQGGGSIVNISAIAAMYGDLSHMSYDVAKAGLHALTRSIATTHGRKNIRANTVATALILTDLVQRFMSQEMLDAFEGNWLLPGHCTVEDVTPLVTFLAGPDASWITGQTFVIDGGATAHQVWYRDGRTIHPRAFEE